MCNNVWKNINIKSPSNNSRCQTFFGWTKCNVMGELKWDTREARKGEYSWWEMWDWRGIKEKEGKDKKVQKG